MKRALALLSLAGCASVLPSECRDLCRPRQVSAYEASMGRARCECMDDAPLEFTPEEKRTWNVSR